MRKEVLVAIVIGFALGLVITFGIWTARKAIKEKGPVGEEIQVSPPERITPPPSPKFPLAIDSPEDESLVNSNKVILSGTTEPEARIVVIFETGETIIEADQKGEFTTEITLESGTNQISVTAFSESGDEVSKTLNVVYSTAEI